MSNYNANIVGKTLLRTSKNKKDKKTTRKNISNKNNKSSRNYSSRKFSRLRTYSMKPSISDRLFIRSSGKISIPKRIS